MKDKLEERMDKLAEVCSKREFTARELFRAFDVDGDGVITKKDLKMLAKTDGDKKYFSKCDLKALYSQVGKKICQGVCNILEEEVDCEEHITIDELMNVLDKNGDGKIKLGEFLRIAKKDGDFMFITRKELESEFEGMWKKPSDDQESFFDRLFN